MNRFLSGACLLALPLCALGAPSQYSVIDLGLQDLGEGLLWPTPGQFCLPLDPNNPTLGGKTCAVAFNSVAEIGSSVIPGQGMRAVMWTAAADGKNENLTNLGLLPNARQAPDGVGPNSSALGLNRIGDVVGQSDTGFASVKLPDALASHGFIWRSGVMTDLGAIAGNGYDSSAEGVNDSREVVGWTTTISSVNGQTLQRAFIWVGGTMYNLTFSLVGGPTVLLSNATAIDCQGNIAATGTPASGGEGAVHSYLLIRQGAARTNCPTQ